MISDRVERDTARIHRAHPETERLHNLHAATERLSATIASVTDDVERSDSWAACGTGTTRIRRSSWARGAPSVASGQTPGATRIRRSTADAGGLVVGGVDDAAEHEADDIAATVTHRLDAQTSERTSAHTSEPRPEQTATTIHRSPESGVVRRQVNIAAMNLAVTPVTLRAQARAWMDANLQPAIISVVDLLKGMKGESGHAGLAELKVLWQTAVTAVTAKPFDGGALVAALGPVAAKANDLETQAEASLVGVGADFTTNVTAAGVLDPALRRRYDDVMEMVGSLALPQRGSEGVTAALLAATTARANVDTAIAALPYNAGTAKTNMLKLATTTNELERQVNAVMEASVQEQMQFGTEFTFTQPAIYNLDPETPNSEAWHAAMQLLKSWEKLVLETKLKIGAEQGVKGPVVSTKALSGGKGKGDEKARVFTYTFRGGTWWWCLNIDPACLETQTQPVTIVGATANGERSNPGAVISAIMRDHIFGLAGAVGVVRDDIKGGGHLTLDGPTTFAGAREVPLTPRVPGKKGTPGRKKTAKSAAVDPVPDEPDTPEIPGRPSIPGNARFYRNLLVLYANDPVKWGAMDQDAVNAPMVSELKGDGKAAFKAAVVKFDAKYSTPTPMTIDSFTKELIGTVFTAKNIGAEKGDKRADQPAHYQATNVEHMVKGDDSRIEMRRFDAQSSVEDLFDNLQMLTKLVAASRQPGLVPLAY